MSRSRSVDYHLDFYSWSLEQARLLRNGSWEQLDRANIADEIEGLAQAEFDKLAIALRTILLHMLNWDHQPAMRSRGVVLSIEAQRIELEDILADNPGLRWRTPEAIARAYRRARLEAAKETELDKSTFPAECPYCFEDIMSREFSL